MASDYYALLGVSSEASTGEIHAAYRRLAKRVHPDVSGDSRLFIRAREARDVLADPVRRARYDTSRWAATIPNRPDAAHPAAAQPPRPGRPPLAEDFPPRAERPPRAEDFETWEPWRPDRAAQDQDFGGGPDRDPFIDRPCARPDFPVGDTVRKARPAARRLGAFLAGCAQTLPLRTVRGCVAVVLLWLLGPLAIRLVLSSFGPTGAAVGGFLASVLNLTLIALLVVRAVTVWQHRRARGERAT